MVDQRVLEEGFVDGVTEAGHLALDIIGLWPAGGFIADGINAAWYWAEGRHYMAGLSAISAIPIAGYAAAPAKAATWMGKFKKLVGTPLAKFGKKYVSPPIAKHVSPAIAKLGAKGSEAAIEAGETALGYGRLGYEVGKSKLKSKLGLGPLKAAKAELAAARESMEDAVKARTAHAAADVAAKKKKGWAKKYFELDNAVLAAQKRVANAGQAHRRILDVPATTRAAEKAAKIHKASRGERELTRTVKGLGKGTRKAFTGAQKLAPKAEKAYLRTKEGFLKQLADRQAADIAGATTTGAKSIINKKYAMTRLFVDLKGILKVDTLKGRLLSRTFVKWMDDADEDQQASLLNLIDVANGDPGSQNTQEALIRLAQFKSEPPTDVPFTDERIDSASTQALKNLYFGGENGPAGFNDRFKDDPDVRREVTRLVTGDEGAEGGYTVLYNLLNSTGVSESKKKRIKNEVVKLIVAAALKS